MGGVFYVIALTFISTALLAQTKVNKEWQTDAGLPSTFEWQASATSPQGNSALVGNRQNGATSDLYVSLTDRDGTLLWEQLFDGFGDNDYGSSAGFLGNDIIVGGATFNPTNNDYDALILRFSETGNLVWNVIYQGPYGGNDAITDLAVSNLGNIFATGGSEGNGTLSDYHTMKINGTGGIVWQTTYDYQGLFEVPAAISVDGNENVIVTGGSSETFSNWDYATVKYTAQGAFAGSHRMNSGIGLDRPAAMSRTADGSIHVTGMASDDGVNYDIRTIKLDSDLQLVWNKTYDESGGEDEATGIDVDGDGNVYVSGTVLDASGRKIMILLKYDVNGTLEWVRKNEPIDTQGASKGADVKVISDTKVIVVGEKTEGGNVNVAIMEYSPDGTRQWEKSVDGGNNAADKASKVKTDVDGNIYVFGKLSDGITEKYTTVKYGSYRKPTTVIFDSTGTQPLFLDRTLIAKFSPDALIEERINKLDITWEKPEFFLKPEKLQALEDSTGLLFKEITFIRLFKHQRTTDTVSISRLGEEVRIPEFWSAFMLVLPEELSVANTIATLNQYGLPVLEYAEYNRILQPADPPCDPNGIDAGQDPDDNSYNDQQSLDPLPYLQSPFGKRGINVESAWCLETGKPHIRVGVMDSGLEMGHPDFEGVNGNVVTGTYDHYTQTLLQPGSADPGSGHGTKVAGVIGAVRNNENAVAGIAGGDHANGGEGVQLQGHRIIDGPAQSLFGTGDLEYVTDAIVMAATDPLLTPPPSYPFQPVHVMNHSWGIKEGQSNPFFTGLNINRLLHDAMRYSVRNKVVSVVARHNLVFAETPIPENALSYPACYDDNWVLNIGATGTNGAYKYKGNGVPTWQALIGGNIDLAAPGSLGEIRTLSNDQDVIGFNGTSASAPHVSGTAGLMLSYKNEPMPDNANLAPEDVEFLMEHTATDAMIPPTPPYPYNQYAADVNVIGYDDYIGHGRLDAGLAMHYLEEPRYDLRHYETGVDDILSTQTINNVTLDHQLGYTNEEGVFFPYSTDYTVVAYQYASAFVHTLAQNEQLAIVGQGLVQAAEGIWPRHSSSNLMAPLQPGNVLLPHERIALNSSGNLWTGYVYHVFLNGVDKGWIPFNPNTFTEPLQFAYSILAEDLTVGITENEELGKPYLYPNPGMGLIQLRIPQGVKGSATIHVLDAQGRAVFSGSSSSENTQFDLQHLNSGHYIVRVASEGETTHLPFIKL